MGRGKTTAMINHLMAGDIPSPVIFITPYHTEIERILSRCSAIGFVTPESDDHKFIEAKGMMAERKNIVSTHALFGMFDLEAEELVRRGGYTLIMDETPSVISTVDVTWYDARNLFSQYVDYDEDGLLKWMTPDYTGRFDLYKKQIESGNTYRYNNTTWLRVTRKETFDAFRDVYLMTYMFPGSTTKPYFDMCGICYDHMYIGGDSPETYRIYSSEQPAPTYDYRSLIQIEDDARINAIGDDKFALTKHWFQVHSYDGKLNELHDNTYNFFRGRAKTPSSQNMWTVFKTSGWNEEEDTDELWRKVISGDGYKRGFVSCSVKGTNQYRHKNTLAYLVNRFQNVPVRNMFTKRGIVSNDDFFGLSEMLQWIWRSAIRDGKPIRLYVPSSRMRDLILQWIDDVGKGVRY